MSEIEVVEVQCAVCYTDTNPDDLVTTAYDQEVCQECIVLCDRCESVETVHDSMYTVDGDHTWCESCAENRAYYCDSCNEYNSYGTSFVEDARASYCESCLEDCYYCEDCDTYTSEGCDNCSSDSDGMGNRIIHDYSYRPDPIFHSTNPDERLFFGIEIEVEASDSRSDSAMHAYQLEGADLAYLKNDGSLDHGFEIVTHPMSHDFYKNEASQLWEVLENLRSKSGLRVKSWDTRTCGLHIHISRTGFSGGAHMHRFLNLVYSNPEFYSALAGRSSDQWAKFTDIYQKEYRRDANGERIPAPPTSGLYWEVDTKRTFKHKLDPNRGSDRYSAVNTLNAHTLEMRIFRGTVNGNTVKAQLDLAHASVEYTRTLSVHDIREGALTADNFMWYIFNNVELYPELNARIDKCIKLDEPVRSTEQVKEVIDTMIAYTINSRSEGITYSYTTNGSN